ncbi:Non-reducing end alpha-L-arabinofuranosidase BoGH43A [Paramyrothecium foliicola]|nr:Non-reducing end alpha-L-arabinofuranosidase BoGH43A [Paramyrothecium foliicola]
MSAVGPPDLNPIIPGFAPDPSIVLVDDTYFLIVSTFHLFPGLPIYCSKDLIHWQHIGNAVNRTSQLNLDASATKLKQPDPPDSETLLATGGLYAPTIRYHDAKFYVVCTNVVHGSGDDVKLENFIVQSQDIFSDYWSDPVYFEFHGIDPSPFWDTDGRAYMQGSAWGDFTTITCMEIDMNTGSIITPEKTIWEGFSKVIPEGPHVYKKDGWYYLLVAEGGTSEDHSIVAARSRSIWGPYESCPRNPLLPAAPLDNEIQHTGHGDLFQDREGQWWMVCLGVRKDGDRYLMGRETFLTAVAWPQGEWPAIKDIQMKGPSSLKIKAEPNIRLQSVSNKDLVSIRNPDPQAVQISPNGHTISICPLPADLENPRDPIAFVGRRIRTLGGEAAVSLAVPKEQWAGSLMAGIAMYKDEHRFIRLFWNHESCSVTFQVLNRAKGISTKTEFPQATKPSTLRLRVQYSAQKITFSFQPDETSEKLAGEVDNRVITGYDFVGPVVGIFAIGADQSGNTILFKVFTVQ